MESKNDDLSMHPVIAKLEQITESEAIVEFDGLIGATTGEVVRVYDDFSMMNYFEVKRADILHVFNPPPTEHGKQRLLIRASASVRKVVIDHSTARVVFRQKIPRPVLPPRGLEFFIVCNSVSRDAKNLRFWIDQLEKINTDGQFTDLINDLKGRLADLQGYALDIGCGAV